MKLVIKPKKLKLGGMLQGEDILSYLAKDHEIIRNISRISSI
jgi:DNA polymerase-1